jgi:hypothetical protein
LARPPVKPHKPAERGSQRADRFVAPLDRMRAVDAAVLDAVQQTPALREHGAAQLLGIRAHSKGMQMTYSMGGRTVVLDTTRKAMKLAASRGELDAFMADLVAKAL